MEELYNKFIDAMIQDLSQELYQYDIDEVECLIFSHLLKTKLYMMSETSHKMNDFNDKLKHIIIENSKSVIEDYLKETI